MPSGRDSATTAALAISPLRKTLQKPNRGTRRVHESCSRSSKELSCAAGLRFGLGLTFLLVQLAGCSGPNYFGSQRGCEFSPVPVYSVHVPARRPRIPLHSGRAFAKINVCRNGIAQAERSGGYRLASLQRLFLHITGSTVTTEPKSLFAGKRAAMSPFTCARITRSNWGPLATTARKPAS